MCNNYATTQEGPVQQDALRLVGTMLRFVRSVEQGFRRASGAELTLSDLSVLAQVDRGCSLPSLLARQLRLDPPRVTRITDRLVSLGYMTRDIDPSDRRRCRLTLTPAGEESLRQSLAAVSEGVDRLLSGLSARDRQALTRGLEAVRAVLEAPAADESRRVESPSSAGS